jgi:nucleotide-binding universal stress UspA family protein
VIQRVLAAIDFSRASKHALLFARENFPNAEIRLLHVIDDFGISAARLRGELKGIATEAEALMSYETQMKHDLNALGEGEVRRGQAALVILEQAQHLNVDLIAMGTHGHRGLEHLILGSVAEQVIRTSSVPVLTLREAV